MIFMLRMVSESAIEMQFEVYLYFIDYANVLDKVCRKERFELLGWLDLLEHL